MNELQTFTTRLSKIGIQIEMIANYPWVYLHKVNGKIVTEKFGSDWGFVMGFVPCKPGDFTNRKGFVPYSTVELFKIIRKYK